jgi:hypothetical protein
MRKCKARDGATHRRAIGIFNDEAWPKANLWKTYYREENTHLYCYIPPPRMYKYIQYISVLSSDVSHFVSEDWGRLSSHPLKCSFRICSHVVILTTDLNICNLYLIYRDVILPSHLNVFAKRKKNPFLII